MPEMRKQKLQYYANFIFLRRNFFLLLILSYLSYHWYTEFSSLGGDSARVQIVLSGIALFFCSAVFLFSLLTSLPPYLSLLFKKRVLATETADRNDVVKISFKEANAAPGLVDADIRIYGIRKPLFGFARVKLIFDSFAASEELLLDRSIYENRKKIGMLSQKPLWLPNVKDYRVKYSFVHFEDFFHLFSWPFREAEYGGVFTEPPRRDEAEVPIITTKSEDPVLKIVQHKVAKGELLDYKKYAPGDDIRRIIWKNYARARELTVRTHDRTFPYVSHINVLVSFYDGSPPNRPLALKAFLLDIYKEKVRQVIDSILEQGFTVKLIIDQSISMHYELDAYQAMLYRVSAAGWQKQLPLDVYIRDNFHRLKGGSNLLVFSSLCPLAQLENLSNGRPQDLNLCFYDAAETFQKSQPPSLVRRVFFVNALDALAHAKRQRQAKNTVRFITHNGEEIKTSFSSSNESVIAI